MSRGWHHPDGAPIELRTVKNSEHQKTALGRAAGDFPTLLYFLSPNEHTTFAIGTDKIDTITFCCGVDFRDAMTFTRRYDLAKPGPGH